MKAVFLLTTQEGQKRIGKIAIGKDGLESSLPVWLWKATKKHGIVANGKLLGVSNTTPEAFVKALPEQFSGSVIRVKVLSTRAERTRGVRRCRR